MKVENYTLEVPARANHHVVDITDAVAGKVAESGVQNGLVCVFNVGATAGITTVEYEPGLERDLEAAFEKLAPSDAFDEHNERWHDGNGFSHVRATLLKPSLTIPLMGVLAITRKCGILNWRRGGVRDLPMGSLGRNPSTRQRFFFAGNGSTPWEEESRAAPQ